MRVAVNSSVACRIDKRALKRACIKALRAERVRRDAVLSLAFLCEGDMCDLNRRYLLRDGPTDVLAFPMEVETPGGFLLGDVVICPDYVVSRKGEYGIEDGKELEYVAIHGILHLLGYEDDDEEGALAMDRRQREILGVAGEVER